MRSRSPGWRFLFAATVFLLAAGCAPKQFVYKPDAPSSAGRKLPVNVAVLPFTDGTEEFTRRGGSISFSSSTWNLAKSGVTDLIPALPPALWAKSYADDMTASGDFQTVRFVYSQSEFVDEEYYIEGTLEKAIYSGARDRPNEFALGLRAVRRADNRLVWEKEVGGVWNHSKIRPEECRSAGLYVTQCTEYADINRAMHDMFAEARLDLVRALAATSGNRADTSGRESADEVIKRILGKP